MSLQTRLAALVTAIGADIKSLKAANAPIDLVALSRPPYYISHRGGSLRFPEETKLGYTQSLQNSFWLEMDVQPNADGELVLMHDDTIDRTTLGSGTVLSQTTTQWKALDTDGPIPGAKRDNAVTWEDVFDMYGGRVVLMPEIKGSNWTLTQRNAFYDAIVARKLQKSVIVQSFTYSYVLEAVAKGIYGCYLGTDVTATQLAADGVKFVGVPTTVVQSWFFDLHAAGIKALVYTVDTLAAKATWLDAVTNPADGIFTNDAWWVSGRQPVSGPNEVAGDDFASKVPWPGMIGNPKLMDLTTGNAARSPRGEFVGSKAWTPYPARLAPETGTYGAPMTFTGTKGPNVIVRTRVTYGQQNTSASRWASIYWGAFDPSIGFNDSSVEPTAGYHFLMRKNGTMDLYRVPVNGDAISLTTNLNGPVIGNGASIILELEINSTGIIGRVIDGSKVYEVTSPNTTNRPAHAYAQLNTNGLYAEFSDFSVRTIP